MQTEYEQNFLVVNTSERGKNLNNSYVLKKRLSSPSKYKNRAQSFKKRKEISISEDN